MTSNGNILFQGSWNGDISQRQCGGNAEETIGNVAETQTAQCL